MTKWLWGFDLNSDVKKQMWEIAWQVYGDSLGEILSLALAGYKRSAGFELRRFEAVQCGCYRAAGGTES